MALVTCTECGKEFSEHAEYCPNCGCPIDVIKEQAELANIKKEPETIEFAKKYKCKKCGCTEFNPIIVNPFVAAECANCGNATFNDIIRRLTPLEKMRADAKQRREREAENLIVRFVTLLTCRKLAPAANCYLLELLD